MSGYSGLVISTLLFSSQVSANTLNDLKVEQNEINKKKAELNIEIKQKETEILSNQNNQDDLLNQILTLNEEIVTTENSMTNVKADINLANIEIENMQKEITDLERKISNRNVVLNERLRAIQLNGGSISFIDVLLSSNSFIDFIDRYSAINTLMDADRNIMKEQSEDKTTLEKKEVELKVFNEELQNSYDELGSLKATLDIQKLNKTELINQLEVEKVKLVGSKENLVHEYEEVFEISEDLQAKIVAEQERMADLARQEEQKKNTNNVTSSASKTTPTSSSDSWTTPAQGRFTSPYGWRELGGKEFHYGVDVANSIGTPIVAAADGVVSYAAPLSTYGNAVIITHSINGEIFTTVYAHMNSIGVNSGQTVSKGQEIGKMGMTGRVTGSHLHFELHIGTWAGQKNGDVNPLSYVPF